MAAELRPLAAQLAVAPTRGLARTKQALHESWERPLAAQLAIYLGYVHYGVRGATAIGLIFVLPADATGRYDYIEIFDSSNADGYVEIAQLGIGPIDFVPSYNAAYGLKDGFVSFGGKERSSGGTLWTDQQRIARRLPETRQRPAHRRSERGRAARPRR